MRRLEFKLRIPYDPERDIDAEEDVVTVQVVSGANRLALREGEFFALMRNNLSAFFDEAEITECRVVVIPR